MPIGCWVKLSMDAKTLNIAMWSGPRNLSTALMRSFAQRADCQVWDEPFYAAYLVATGIDHPMRQEVIADGISDPSTVISACLERAKKPRTVFYQKHMTLHMGQHRGVAIDRAWMKQVNNAFLIRAPQKVLASYAKKRQTVSAEDLGYQRQLELFEQVCDFTSAAPPVIDSNDIRKAPEAMLRTLCGRLGIDFDPAMLSWEKGPSADDGIWGKHWYDGIWKSTGFAPPEEKSEPLPDNLQALCDEVMGDYLAVEKYKITLEETI